MGYSDSDGTLHSSILAANERQAIDNNLIAQSFSPYSLFHYNIININQQPHSVKCQISRIKMKPWLTSMDLLDRN